MSDHDPLLKLSQVKERLNCSLAHAHALVSSGQLKHIRIGLRKHGGIRVRLSDLEQFIQSREAGGAPEKPRPAPPVKLKHLHLD